MSDKAAVLREADETFEELVRTVDGLGEDEFTHVWLGTWGVREILIHISGWHREMIPALERVARGEAPHPTGMYDDFDAWNARFVERKAGAKRDEILEELGAAHRDFMDAARALPETDLAAGGAARELFDGAGPAHCREHATQIREWRQRAHR